MWDVHTSAVILCSSVYSKHCLLPSYLCPSWCLGMQHMPSEIQDKLSLHKVTFLHAECLSIGHGVSQPSPWLDLRFRWHRDDL
jgi:hypothetical protein